MRLQSHVPAGQPTDSRTIRPPELRNLGTGFWIGAMIGVRGLGAASRSLRAQGFSSAVYLVGALGGAAAAGAAGAAWGSAAASLIAAVIWYWQLDRGLREFQSPAEPGGRVDTAHLPDTGA
jgi:hypothetical protein